ncbi:histone-lysine N-methyltransferase family protein [Tanacetum coccineum]|uniref:Histone-lysine N-methyltransferase family protein n=1 Tax=Tanacetum coccineum TaxID=301880 RepID=A0ABQ4XW05_9ASTR
MVLSTSLNQRRPFNDKNTNSQVMISPWCFGSKVVMAMMMVFTVLLVVLPLVLPPLPPPPSPFLFVPVVIMCVLLFLAFVPSKDASSV